MNSTAVPVPPTATASGDYSLDVLAARLHEAGIRCEVAMTGGWVATLFAGPDVVIEVDEDGVEYRQRAILVGPGAYRYPADGGSIGTIFETYVGPDTAWEAGDVIPTTSTEHLAATVEYADEPPTPEQHAAYLDAVFALVVDAVRAADAVIAETA